MKNGWEVKKLGEVLIKSSSNISQNQLSNEYGDYPIYGASGFIKNISFYHQDKAYISIVKDGAGIGRISLKEAYSSVIGTLQYLIPVENIDIRFIFYFLLGMDFSKYKNGSTIPHIYFKDYAEEQLLLPPLTEQQHIVAILDEAFETIARAKENAEKNLQNAKDIFESYLQSVFANKGYGWEEKKLGEVCEIIGGGTPSKPNLKYYDGNIFWATVRDMKMDIVTETEFKITNEAVINSSTNIIPKDNVIIATRVGLGKVCLLNEDTAINQDLKGVIPKSSRVLSTMYLFLWLKSIAGFIKKNGTGATVQGVKLPFIKNIKIPVPPLAEQHLIVTKLDALSTETKKLESIYNQKLADLEELKKSILQKAFNGEL